MWIWQHVIVSIALIVCCPAPVLSQETFELTPQGFEQVKAPDPDTPEGKLHVARQTLAGGEAKQAEKVVTQWIKEYPNHPLLDQAYLLRGDAKTAQDHFYEALFDYEYVLRAFPGSEAFDTALEREFHIAEAFGRGVKRRLWGIRMIPAHEEAEEILIRIQERSPGSQIAERAGIELADYYYRQANMTQAAVAYELFIENYPQSQWREHAMQRQILANLATFKGPRFDATGLIEAQNRLADYSVQFPAAAEQIGAEALDTRIDETLATRALLVAKWYDDRGQDVSAIFMYKRVIRDHPGSAAAQRALDRLAELDPRNFGPQAPTVPVQPPPPDEAPAAAPAATPAPAPGSGGAQP